MAKELEKVRLHYIYCVYGDADGPVEEVRDFFSLDIGENTNKYSVNELGFYLAEDGQEYVKFFNDESPFNMWNKAFKREGSEFGYYDDICYFGINYYDSLVPVEELEYIQNQIEKRRKELCLM